MNSSPSTRRSPVSCSACTNPLAGPTQPLDLALDSLHSEVFRILAQIRCVQRRIEVISVVEVVLGMDGVRLRRPKRPARAATALTQKLSICGKAGLPLTQIQLVKVDSGNVAAVAAEG